MSTSESEIEVKFLIISLENLESRLISLGAQPVQARVHEVNLRFDLPDGSLTQQHRVLRLRQDEKARLTYKDPSGLDERVSIRREIEFEVSNFESAQHFLEALGYCVSVTYEKYRRTYAFEDSYIMLDEMPFGDFAEIEAASADIVQARAAKLGLKWENRCIDSYMALFERLKQNRGIKAQNLTFEEVSGIDIDIDSQDLGLSPAD